MWTDEQKETLTIFLNGQGYYNIKILNDGRFICLFDFLYTTGIIIDASFGGYEGRYCYPDKNTAIEAINKWDGKGDAPEGWVAKK